MLFLHCIILSRTVKLVAGIVAAVALVGGAVGIGVHFGLKTDNSLSTGPGTGSGTDAEGSLSGANDPAVVLPDNNCEPKEHPYEENTTLPYHIRQVSSKLCISFNTASEDMTGVVLAIGGAYYKETHGNRPGNAEYAEFTQRCGTHIITWTPAEFQQSPAGGQWRIPNWAAGRDMGWRDAGRTDGITTGAEWTLTDSKGVNGTAVIGVGEAKCCDVPCYVCMSKESSQSGQFDGSWDLVESEGVYHDGTGTHSLIKEGQQYSVVTSTKVTNLQTSGYSVEKGRCPGLRTICMRMDFMSADFKFVKFWNDEELGRHYQFGWEYIGDNQGVSYTLRYTKRWGDKGHWRINNDDELKDELGWSSFYVSVEHGMDPFEVFQPGHIWDIWMTEGGWSGNGYKVQRGMVVASSCPDQDW